MIDELLRKSIEGFVIPLIQELIPLSCNVIVENS